MPAETRMPTDWFWHFSRRDEHQWTRRYGAYDIELPRLAVNEIATLSLASGIHPDVLGPCRRAAAKLNWYLLFRPIKTAAAFHVGDFDKLPKPVEIKTKADAESGMIRFNSAKGLEAAVACGDIDGAYAAKHGLWVDAEGFLRNNKGQRYFSDMDLYDVLDGDTGRQIPFGDGASPTGGVKNRRELDILINALRPLGTSFALIQHGPDRQWVRHSERNEHITAFCPNGNVFVLRGTSEVAAFIATAQTRRPAV
jgi:hypothetical protein